MNEKFVCTRSFFYSLFSGFKNNNLISNEIIEGTNDESEHI